MSIKQNRVIKSIFILIVMSVFLFQPLSSQSTGITHAVKVEKTSVTTDFLLKHQDYKIIQELNTCYIALLNTGEVHIFKSNRIPFQIIDTTSDKPDKYYLFKLRDIKNLDFVQQYGTAVAVEGNHILFRQKGTENPARIKPEWFKGIKKLGHSVTLTTGQTVTETSSARFDTELANALISQMAGYVSKTNIRNMIQTLQDYGSREATTSKCTQAGTYLYTTLQQYGLSVSYDSFTFEGNSSRNVIGYLAGKTDSSKVVIISAHYDSYANNNSTTNAPGADDNASGVAAVMEAARIMSSYSFDYSIKFILFSAEEWGLYGSEHYAKVAKNNGEKILGVINLDMVSYADHAPEDLDIITNSNSTSLGSVVQSAAQDYSSISTKKTNDSYYDYSDHSSFWDYGFPAVLCIEDYDDTNPYYHTAGDTIGTLDLDFASQVARTCLAGTAQLAQPKATVTGSAAINLNRSQLKFTALSSGISSPNQEIWIKNTGQGTLNWTVSDNASWLTCSPGSGTNSGIITVSVNASGLGSGTYTASISVSSSDASNSPQTVSVQLIVKNSSQASLPFGEFSTPVDNSTVCSSIPVTGWALDDIGIQNVKIYRESGQSKIYIGDAVLVEGTRPDVETAYPNYPSSYKAGWGYMLLTNFLPNSGNGTFKLIAVATDAEGHEFTLGSKTINVDNAHATKPFGAIEFPEQGGTASGSSYINWGWALTPKPGTIPTSGSTIQVIIDGVNVGNPTYNINRTDIESLFPGYNNSNGAVGYYSFDTTQLSSGLHTIAWGVTDNHGNTDGIGSRYFSVMNTGSTLSSSSKINGQNGFISSTQNTGFPEQRFKSINALNIDRYPIQTIRIKELSRLELPVPLSRSLIENEKTDTDVPASQATGTHSTRVEGYMLVGKELRDLPVGSTLDCAKGIFYWLPGPGFVGKYSFIFIEKNSSGIQTINRFDIEIRP